MQKKLPLINSAHGSDTRNIINELIKLFNGMGYTYEQSVQRAQSILSEAQSVNKDNIAVNERLNNILGELTEDSEVVDARGEYAVLGERLEENYNMNIMPQAPKPPKSGLMTNAPKLIYKSADNILYIYQKMNNGYLKYKFHQNFGGDGYGVNYELLRITTVENIDSVTVMKSVNNPDSGTIEKTFTSDFPSLSSSLYFGIWHPNAGNYDYEIKGAEPNVYTISSGNHAGYNIDTGKTGKMNIVIYDRANSTVETEYKIKFDGVVLKTGSNATTGSTSFREISFDAPLDRRGQLTIENTGPGNLYLFGINMLPLEKVDGHDCDTFISISKKDNIDFMTSNGASDYALKNADNGVLFGSYHGGEISEYCKIEKDGVKTDFASVATDEFWTSLNFAIHQKTKLIEVSTMQSIFDFNVDGTVNMDFSWNVDDPNSPMNLSTFWVALTATAPELNLLKVPEIMEFSAPEEASGGHYYFDIITGHVIQSTKDGSLEMHSRFPTFVNKWMGASTPSYISDQTFYRKHYYSPIMNYSDGVLMKSFQTSKSLDFYRY